MKKRLLNIFFALALVLGLSPMSAFAEDGTNGVASMDLTVKPILGAKIGTADSISYIHTKDITTTPALDSGTRRLIDYPTYYKILDKDYTGNAEADKAKMAEVTDENEVFQDGYHYYLIEKIIVTDQNRKPLPFKKDTTATINKEAASVELIENDYYLSVAAYVDVFGFYNIDTTLTAPALGENADYAPTFTIAEGLDERPAYDLGITSIKATTWYKIAEDDFTTLEDSKWIKMEADEEYAKGYFYMVKFDILEYNDPELDYLARTISKNLTGTLNEEDFDKIVVADDQYSAELYKLYEPFGGRKKVVSAQEVANPKTADEGNLAISLLLLSVTGGAVAAVAILGKRR